MLSGAESAALNITAPLTAAQCTRCNVNQAMVTYSVEEGRREMLVTQLYMTFNNGHLSDGAQQADTTSLKTTPRKLIPGTPSKDCLTGNDNITNS